VAELADWDPVGGMVHTHDHPIDSNKPQFLALGTPPS